MMKYPNDFIGKVIHADTNRPSIGVEIDEAYIEAATAAQADRGTLFVEKEVT
jgi:hypothetical protein